MAALAHFTRPLSRPGEEMLGERRRLFDSQWSVYTQMSPFVFYKQTLAAAPPSSLAPCASPASQNLALELFGPSKWNISKID